jgi:hypothetical protein
VSDITFKRLGTAGNAVVLLIPAVMRAKLHWLKGDWIQLTLDDTANTITLKAVPHDQLRPAPPKPTQEHSELPL